MEELKQSKKVAAFDHRDIQSDVSVAWCARSAPVASAIHAVWYVPAQDGAGSISAAAEQGMQTRKTDVDEETERVPCTDACLCLRHSALEIGQS